MCPPRVDSSPARPLGTRVRSVDLFGYDPPDVTWLEPELLDGADVPCRPPLDEALPEPDDVAALDPELLADVLWLAAVACVDAGRLTATPPAATRLVRPAATVTVRILARLRSLAAIFGARPVGRARAGSGGIGGFLSDSMTPGWPPTF
jgi:hypothetical protein